MKEQYTQWHPAFCAAVKLELVDNKKELEYSGEYNINTKPIQIDLLVIKKSNDVCISNEIGKIFRGHNIMEYKSPDDSLDVDVFVKVIGYACLYKANEKYLDEIHLDDITLSFVRDGYPRELFKWFKVNEFVISNLYQGIYYVEKEGFFPAQIIVGSQLRKESHAWLTSLSRNMNEKDVERLVLNINSLSEKEDKDNADAVLQVSATENEILFDQIKEGYVMCEALMRIMKPEFDAAVNAAVEARVEEAVNAAVNAAVEEAVNAAVNDERVTLAVKMYREDVPIEIICKHFGFEKEEFLEIEKKHE